MCTFHDNAYYDGEEDEICLDDPFEKRFEDSLKVFKVSNIIENQEEDDTFILAKTTEKAIEFSRLKDLNNLNVELIEERPVFSQRVNNWNEPIEEIIWEPENSEYDTEYCIVQRDLYDEDPSHLLYSDKFL